MKKRLLSLLLVFMLVVSLVPGVTISASAEETTPNAIIKGTDIHMELGATYTFAAESVAITSGSAVTLDGKTITAAEAGTAVVTADDKTYTVGVLPDGYTVLYYLESSGSQYISTGYYFNANTVLEASVQFAGNTGAAFGYYGNTSHGLVMYTGNSINCRGSYVAGKGNDDQYIWDNPTDVYNRNHVMIKNGAVTLNGECILNLGFDNITSNLDLYLFAYHADWDIAPLGRSSSVIYSFRISEGETICRDFVPAITEGGVYGMYDAANNQWYGNKGTGDFKGGFNKKCVVNLENAANINAEIATFEANTVAEIPVTTINGYNNLKCGILKKEDRTDVTEALNASYDQTNGKIKFTMPDYDVILRLVAYSGKLAYHDAGIVDPYNPDSMVEITTVSSTNYLFLPSSADMKAVPLLAEAGTKLTGTEAGQSIIVSNEFDETYDLTTLFGTMTAGEKYALTVTYPSEIAVAVQVVQSANVPTMYVTSDKTISQINADATKSVIGAGTVTVVNPDGTVLYDGGMDSFKGRGNTSWDHIAYQKPYNIKLSKKAELIKGAGKAKKWCLMAGDMYGSSHWGNWINEIPMLSQMMGYQLYKDLNGAYNYEFSPIDLYFNGEYRGTYVLVEAIQLDKARVNITETEYLKEGTKFSTGTVSVTSNGVAKNVDAKWSTDAVIADGTFTGGFILELDAGAQGTNDCYFKTTYGNRYLFKDPGEPTKAQVEKIAQYVQDYEDALYADSGYNSQGKYYAEYIDLDSVAIGVATQEIAIDGDMFQKSEYFTIDVDENGNFSTKLINAPTWDFDYSPYQVRHFFIDQSNPDGIKLLAQFLKHADFVAKLDGVLMNDAKTVAESYSETDGLIEQWIEKYSIAKGVSYLRWPSGMNFNGSALSGYGGANSGMTAAAFKQDFAAHTGYLYSDIWKNNILRGVTVAYDTTSDKFVATPNSTATDLTYQWYTVSETGALTELTGKTGAELLNPDDGKMYEVAVTAGTNSVLKTGSSSNTTYETKSKFTSIADGKAVASIQFSAPVSATTVSFNMNGHGTAIDSVTATVGSTISAPNTPSADGWSFDGWYSDSEMTKLWDFAKDKVEGSMTLYAKWTEKATATAPSAASLTYNNSEQTLVTGGSAVNGTLNYALGTNATTAPDTGWGTTVPKGKAADTYYVWYKAVAKEGYADSDAGCVTVTIDKANPTVTPPTAVANLVYTGGNQALVENGSATNGTMKYALGTDAKNAPTSGWDTAVPTGNAEATYYVWYKVEGNTNYNDVAPACVTVTIGKGNPTVTPPTAVANLVYTGGNQALVENGSATNGTMKYALGTDATNAPTSGWDTAVPTGNAEATYYVWYKVDGNTNYNDVAPACVTVTIGNSNNGFEFLNTGIKTILGLKILQSLIRPKTVVVVVPSLSSFILIYKLLRTIVK